MSADDLESLFEEHLPKLSGLGAMIKFDLGADGTWLVDATGAKAMLVEDEDEDGDCTVKISADNLSKLLEGRMDPMLAYAMGRIKVSGRMGVAMALVSAIG